MQRLMPQRFSAGQLYPGWRALLIAASLVSALGATIALPPAMGQVPAGSTQFHPPAERHNAAAMESFQIPSHGSLLNAFLYIAAGAGPHPTVILLHGLPGNERNLDVAQDLRRAGWNVLYMDYRGSWGSPEDFSFSHSVEDVTAAVAYLRQPSVSTRSRIDPGRFILMGHSMGGFLAVQAAANDPSIAALVLISPVDFGGMPPPSLSKADEPAVLQGLAAGLEHQGIAPLHGCTPEGLARDILLHSEEWKFSSKAGSLASRPIFLMTSDDGWAQSNEAFAADLRKAGSTNLTTRHLSTDHSYSDKRSELSSEILRWLSSLPKSGTR